MRVVLQRKQARRVLQQPAPAENQSVRVADRLRHLLQVLSWDRLNPKRLRGCSRIPRKGNNLMPIPNAFEQAHQQRIVAKVSAPVVARNNELQATALRFASHCTIHNATSPNSPPITTPTPTRSSETAIGVCKWQNVFKTLTWPIAAKNTESASQDRRFVMAIHSDTINAGCPIMNSLVRGRSGST